MNPLQFTLAVAVGLVVLSLLVFVHELGHFLAAKACKIRVIAFALGFGKPIFKIKRGETEYRVNRIPFGGYVAMASDSPVGETAGGDNEFNSHPIWKRALVAIAGPIANFIFALAALWLMFVSGVDRPVFLDSTRIGLVIEGSAADSAGLRAGDSVTAINGKPVDTWDKVEITLAQQPKVCTVSVRREGRELKINLNIERTGAKMSKSPTGGILPASPSFRPVVGGVLPDGAAKNALAPGDSLISINGAAVASFYDFSMIVRNYDSTSGPLAITFDRGGNAMTAEITPAYDSKAGRFLVGVSPQTGETRVTRYGPVNAVSRTAKKSWDYTTMIFGVLGNLISGSTSAELLSGPLNIIPASGLMAFQGLEKILDFMALISINLAVLNLMPLVITDGGLLVFLLIEAVRGKPLNAKTQMVINKIFIALFVALFLFVTMNDVKRMPDFFKMFR